MTSGTRSPILKKSIAHIDIVHAAFGAEVGVGRLDGKMKTHSAKVVCFPHYETEKTRVRA